MTTREQKVRKRRTGKHNMSRSIEYKAYILAKGRCNNVNKSSYKLYGARGIEFRFKSFQDFYSCIGTKPTAKHSLERIDSNGHYEPGNVRWATNYEQVRNRRSNILFTHNGKTMCINDWCNELGLCKMTVYQRLYRRWSKRDAIFNPVLIKHRKHGQKQ